MITRHITALVRTCARLGRDERGGETIEYAMTLGFLAMMSYAMIQMVGVKVYSMWERIDRALSQLG